MNTLILEQTLINERNYWQSLMEYMIEAASMDVNSNVTFDVAKQTTAAIDRALKRIRAGGYGKCERCGADIDSERLEALIDSDCHLCIHCAKACRVPATQTSQKRNQRLVHRLTVHAGQSA